MRRVYERLYTGGQEDCFEGAARWAVVHACRHPCFRRAAGRLGVTSESQAHLEDGMNLYLDLIDAPARYFSTPPFEAFLSFAGRHWGRGAGLLIHCNQGVSRGPSLAMLFLARYSTVLPAGPYEEASAAFSRLLPGYSPGAGMRSFLGEQWENLRPPIPAAEA
jgi:hypothetical protein